MMKSKNNFRNVKLILQKIFVRPKYQFIAFASAFLLVAFVSLALNYASLSYLLASNLDLAQKVSFVTGLLGGIITNNTHASLAFLLAISALFGMNSALLFFKKDSSGKSSTNEKATVSVGTTAGILASGCASCGGILALLGVVGGAAALPFSGLELWIPSAALLVASIFWSSKNISNCPSCSIVLKENNLLLNSTMKSNAKASPTNGR